MLTQERLKELLTYNLETGVFTRNLTRCGALAGAVAGSVTRKGYRYIKIDSKGYMMHRLVWLYLYGQFPKEQLDHIDGDKLNNKASNLRDAITSQNCVNQRGRKNNTSGFKGVILEKSSGKWVAQCNANGEHYYLGMYDTPQEASNVRETFAKENHAEFYKPL